MKDELMKMNLQYFAADDEGSDESGADGQDKGEQGEDKGSDKKDKQEEQEEMIPKSQMEKIIKDRVAREKKVTEKAIEEATKLSKMNQEEKTKYEYEQLRKELDEYKKKDSHYSMSKEASKMLADSGIPADDEVFEVVVKDTAEDTKERVEWFSGLINRLVEQGVTKALSGTAPKVHTNKSNTMTKEEFTKLSYPEKLELKRTNEEQYKKLIN